jgi:hypothetical protein
MPLNSEKEVAQQARQIVRNVVSLCNTMRALPDERFLTMKLFYDNDITPPSFQPRYFEDALSPASDTLPLIFKKKPLKLNAGDLCTTHHSMSILLQILDDDENDSRDKNENDIVMNPNAVSKANQSIGSPLETMTNLMNLEDVEEEDGSETQCPEIDSAKYHELVNACLLDPKLDSRAALQKEFPELQPAHLEKMIQELIKDGFIKHSEEFPDQKLQPPVQHSHSELTLTAPTCAKVSIPTASPPKNALATKNTNYSSLKRVAASFSQEPHTSRYSSIAEPIHQVHDKKRAKK